MPGCATYLVQTSARLALLQLWKKACLLRRGPSGMPHVHHGVDAGGDPCIARDRSTHREWVGPDLHLQLAGRPAHAKVDHPRDRPLEGLGSRRQVLQELFV